MQKILELTPNKIGWMATLLVCALFVIKPNALEILELQMIDLRFKTRGPLQPGPEVVLAVVDEKSQDALGRWPWPRSVLAGLVDKLTAYNAFTIAFDIVFSESGDDVYHEAVRMVEQQAQLGKIDPAAAAALREQFLKEKTGDELFADALQRNGNTVLAFFFHDDPRDILHLSSAQIRQGLSAIERFRYKDLDIRAPEGMEYIDRILSRPAVEANLPLFADAAFAAGYFNLVPDADGIMRRYPVIMKGGANYYAPFWLHTVTNYRENKKISIVADEFGIQEVTAGGQEIPVDLKGRFLINYYGGPKTFPHYSISDILQDRIPADAFDSKIVLVGATGKGIFDLRATPFNRVYPGLEINATIIDNIVQENFLKRPPGYDLFTYLIILVLGLILTGLISRLSAGIGFLTSILFLTGYYFFNLEFFKGAPLINGVAGAFVDYRWIRHGYWLNLVYPSLVISLVYVSITAFNYFRENKQKQFIRGAFGQYLSPTVVKQLVDDPNLLKLGGEQKRMTAFFSDVAGFSTISEKLTPHQLVELLNEYLTAMTEIILRHDGTIDKYEGDAIIAFWGAPVNDPEHARRACIASLEMQRKLEAMRHAWRARGQAELRARIGLNTGLMVVGNMGSANRMDYTIMGDAVNLASRLEGVNKMYGTNLMISQFTYDDVRDVLECRELDRIRVVGKTEPVAIYEVLAEKGQLDPTLRRAAACYAQALAEYRKKEWARAIALFTAVLELVPEDAPATAFIERCRNFKSARKGGRRGEDTTYLLPDDWDGVFQMTSK